jgi:hypothetical protein
MPAGKGAKNGDGFGTKSVSYVGRTFRGRLVTDLCPLHTKWWAVGTGAVMAVARSGGFTQDGGGKAKSRVAAVVAHDVADYINVV